MKIPLGKAAAEVLLISWPFLLPVVALLGTLWLVGWPSGYTPLPFSTDAWAQATAEERGYMVNDLLRNFPLDGKTEEEVRALLGPPDDTTESTWYYRTGYHGANPRGIMVFSYTLHIRFDPSGRVCETGEDD